jgi:hypothetical protein
MSEGERNPLGVGRLNCGTSNTVRVVQIQTAASAGVTQIVVRNGAGKKLFDMDIPGVTIVIAVPLDAEIKIEPDRRGEDRNG